jgi:peptidoglycan/xylan/chitin deacetylase (PgdA/CDA1 family)
VSARILVSIAAAITVLGAVPAASARSSDHVRPTPPAVKVPILMYHLIGTPAPSTPNQDLWVDARELRQEVAWLAGHGYQAVTLQRWWDAWHGGASLPSRPVIFTFDDGFADWYQNAYPILAARGWVGSMQLALSHLGRLRAPPPALSPYAWKLQPYMIREMLAAGWELDSHSLTHPMLTQVSPAQLHAEVYDSRTQLQSQFGVPVSFFCYPYGDYDATVIAAVKRAGYVGALSTADGVASSRGSPYVLRRIAVMRGDGAPGLRRAFVRLGLAIR